MSDRPSESQILLIVEDNEEDYEAITRAFKKVHLPNPIFWCKSGQEVLDFLRRAGPSDNKKPLLGLILLDLNMPGLDGRQTLQAIKEDATLKRIPVVIFTTSSNERDVQGCYQMGANAYIQKPSSFQDMIRVAESIKNYWFETALLPKNGYTPE
ncbi:MAG: response regulator [Alphaproteobacteria bacterium]|nr:response regulator [Alphaproteobacteria bacterium]